MSKAWLFVLLNLFKLYIIRIFGNFYKKNLFKNIRLSASMAISSSELKNFSKSILNMPAADITKIGSPIIKCKTKMIGGLKKDVFELKKSALYDPVKTSDNIVNICLPRYSGELLKVDVPIEPKPADIEKIQCGVFGKIRTSKELAPKDVVKIIQFQQQNISPKEIERILNQFSAEDRPLAEELLLRMTQFASYDSLGEITRQAPKGILEDRLTGLGSTIRYLSKHKGTFDKEPEFVSKEGSFIVDKIFLERIESDKEYLNEILSKDSEFIIPEGFIDGINLFNQTQDIETLLKELLSSAKSIKKKYPELSDSKAVSVALNAPVIKRLKNAGIHTKPRIIQNPNVARSGEPIADIVAKQLNGKFIEEENISAILEKYPPEKRQFVLEILARTLNTKTTRKLSERLEGMHKTILSLNKGSEEGIYYVIPQDVKSYTLVATQYQLTNNIHPSKIIRLEELSQKLPADARKIVVLDDLAGSGHSLETAYVSIVEQLEKNKGNNVDDVFLAPILSTPEALQKLNDIGIGKYRCTCIPTELTEGITHSEYFSSLSCEEQKIYRSLLDGSGYEGGSLSVTFPYMAPDNNSHFFSNNLASYFTLNGAGVKGKAKFTGAKLEF